ncbi:GH92 family glycosyl hydrolase [Salinimicrobium tongyeongense]|uniref:GH92 family glycosyl hydrolase n=1 Tax=Salinimicrobium tongyeongense TaxID=2809707 RepID=A0ABY6NUT9_9FLAO|nr:GH92 family glycosyl hydrolase [Salinimicrobium tongyeongense]UZH56685.1 GH92 family glycosyl hydrolase [Salinimicrobium tongyeongense]
MNKNILYLVSFSFIFLCSCNRHLKENLLTEEEASVFVDPFIGTGGHGHTYPGATVPFGMIQLSPDNGKQGWDWSSGYHISDTVIVGFSHLHLSGTGIGDLADLLFMPANRKIDLTIPVETRDDIPYKSVFSHSKEEASPGYYRVFLEDPEVEVELTASVRTGYQKYKYSHAGDQSIIVDLGFAINWDSPLETKITIEDDYTMSGYRHSTGWAKNQKVFFVAKFSSPIVSKSLVSDGQEVNENSAEGAKTATQLFFNLDKANELQVKLALSSVSIENARQNLNNEKIDFDLAKNEAAALWEDALKGIKVETEEDSLKTIFYTALYHTKMAPVIFSDKNGEFRASNDSILKAENFTTYTTLSLWDTFRAQQPLLTLTNPEKVSDIIKSMLAYYKVEGALPVWTLYGNETNTMTGYHSIPVIAEAYFKGIRDFDVEQAYTAMKKTMMQDQRGLKFYKERGYIPFHELDESVTYTLEYAYNDWCIAQMAKALDKLDDYRYFSNRAKAYEKMFDPETGFMRGKAEDGETWSTPFDPKFSSHMENTDYTEGNAWQHSWFVLHEPQELIELHGGAENFSSKLEQLFTEDSEIKGENASADISGLIGQYAHGNEPSHHIAYLFNKAGKPWLTQFWVREILSTQYSTQPDGLSGNEDAGQMSAWYVFSSMGLYPFNPAAAEYEIGSPVFEQSVIQLKDGNTFTIKAENVSNENRYIQSATLNGKHFDRTTISHSEITNGGELIFKMGKEPNKNWGLKTN